MEEVKKLNRLLIYDFFKPPHKNFMTEFKKNNAIHMVFFERKTVLIDNHFLPTHF